eukprot:scaffold17568_cov90-Isochrysis_galbana.AAC.3
MACQQKATTDPAANMSLRDRKCTARPQPSQLSRLQDQRYDFWRRARAPGPPNFFASHRRGSATSRLRSYVVKISLTSRFDASSTTAGREAASGVRRRGGKRAAPQCRAGRRVGSRGPRRTFLVVGHDGLGNRLADGCAGGWVGITQHAVVFARKSAHAPRIDPRQHRRPSSLNGKLQAHHKSATCSHHP